VAAGQGRASIIANGWREEKRRWMKQWKKAGEDEQKYVVGIATMIIIVKHALVKVPGTVHDDSCFFQYNLITNSHFTMRVSTQGNSRY